MQNKKSGKKRLEVDMKTKLRETVDLIKVRWAIAEYMDSEGCGCCSDTENHNYDKMILAKLLKIPKYKGGSGYNFNKYVKDPKNT